MSSSTSIGRHPSRRWHGVALIALIGWGPSVSAQTAPEGLEEVVVTAQKRKENLQEVPISITALSETALTDNNLHSIQDLAGYVPSLVVTNSVSYGLAPISIRGVGGPSGGGSLFNDEPVAVYVDGVYVSALGQSISDILDVQSLEVLRGPQGTLYGRNSTAGAILIGSNRPTTTFEGYAKVGYDSQDNFRSSAAMSGPLIGDTLLARLAVGYHDGGNFATNSVNGEKIGGSTDLNGRLTLEYRPSEDFRLDIIGDASESKAKPFTIALGSVFPVNAGPAFGTLYAGNPYAIRSDLNSVLRDNRTYLDTPQFTDTDSADLTVLANADLGWATLDSITGFRHFNVRGAQDGDGLTTLTPLDTNSTHQIADNWSEELRLTSPSGRAFRWVGGLYYEHQENNDQIVIDSYQGGPPVFSPHFVPQGAAAGTSASFGGTQSLNDYAVFLDANYDLTDQLTLTAGGRYGYETKDVALRQLVTTLVPTAVAGPVLASGVCPAPGIPCTDSTSNFSPRAVLNYKLTGESLLYASYSKGFNSGGFNSFGTIATAANTDPANPLETRSESISAYEIGSKNEFFDRRLRFNLDGFYYDYSNLQIRQAVYTGGVSVVNVPRAEVKGIEAETTLVPFPNLTLRLNGTYLDADLKSGSLSAIPLSTGTILYGQSLTITPQDIAGNRMARAPRWEIYTAADYNHDLAGGVLKLGANLRYQSSEFFSEVNQQSNAYRSTAWRTVDLHATFASDDGRWEAALFGQNIFDNRHLTQIVPYVGFPMATVNPPRTVGTSLTVNF